MLASARSAIVSVAASLGFSTSPETPATHSTQKPVLLDVGKCAVSTVALLKLSELNRLPEGTKVRFVNSGLEFDLPGFFKAHKDLWA